MTCSADLQPWLQMSCLLIIPEDPALNPYVRGGTTERVHSISHLGYDYLVVSLFGSLALWFPGLPERLCLWDHQ
jgi:hypothetical protein